MDNTNTAPVVIPTLAGLQSLPVVATFAAFKEEEKISFVRSYDPKVQAIKDYRHVVIRYRETDKTKASKPAQMVTIPVLTGLEKFAIFEKGEPAESLARMLLNTLEDEQDSMVRSYIDQGVSNLGWDLLSLENVIASYNAVRTSQRLTKEQIEGWANIALVAACNTRADQISVAKSFNETETAKQRAGTLNAYRELAMKLAAPVPNIGQNQATALQNMLLVAGLDDDIAKALKAKLHQILNPKVTESNDL